MYCKAVAKFTRVSGSPKSQAFVDYTTSRKALGVLVPCCVPRHWAQQHDDAYLDRTGQDMCPCVVDHSLLTAAVRGPGFGSRLGASVQQGWARFFSGYSGFLPLPLLNPRDVNGEADGREAGIKKEAFGESTRKITDQTEKPLEPTSTTVELACPLPHKPEDRGAGTGT